MISDPTPHDPDPSDADAADPDDLRPSFRFDFEALDDLGPDQRWSTWLAVQPLCRGPEPRPDWVVTSQGAVDTELGVLKTGKEADAHLLHRGLPDADEVPGLAVTMVAKRYRSPEHRDFHRSAVYTDGRRVRRSRDARAIERGSRYGREVAAGQWAWAEWQALGRLWQLGVPVPYPVQIDGTELLMEWIHLEGDDGPVTAPRLAQTRPTPALLARWWEQLRDAMLVMAEAGLVHGDLSPYNVLAAGERLVIIDLPQIVDLIANPHGADLLHRDCLTMARWFAGKGLDVDGEALYGEVLGAAW
ncbi:phosphotransferase [Nocardioides fonticola]|uniref:non-specific serine/threonine protein kinase n=1 Tax=Nocardioides fonticola TaxID=450363 RepID=A0ABP7XAZ1_9ACTN